MFKDYGFEDLLKDIVIYSITVVILTAAFFFCAEYGPQPPKSLHTECREDIYRAVYC